jgi:hypothetical protein
MPTLSSTMTEGKIVSWIKSKEDRLSKGERVVVVESNKANIYVKTFYDGILAAKPLSTLRRHLKQITYILNSKLKIEVKIQLFFFFWFIESENETRT